MALLFVDGSVHREGGEVHGGLGVVLIAKECDAGSIFARGRYIPPSQQRMGRVTNQRVELAAIRFGLGYAVALLPSQTPIYLWSDSEYALGVLGSRGWLAQKNLDLIMPIQEFMRQHLGHVFMNHIRSHIARKSKRAYPDMLFHEMADVVASAAARQQADVERVIRQERNVNPTCLACQHYACWQESSVLEAMVVEPGDEPCDDFEPWSNWAVKGFTKEEVNRAWHSICRP